MTDPLPPSFDFSAKRRVETGGSRRAVSRFPRDNRRDYGSTPRCASDEARFIVIVTRRCQKLFSLGLLAARHKSRRASLPLSFAVEISARRNNASSPRVNSKSSRVNVPPLPDKFRFEILRPRSIFSRPGEGEERETRTQLGDVVLSFRFAINVSPVT